MSIEAMKQALEALNKNEGEFRVEGACHILRTAIETAEKQEPTGKQSLQVEQEPVAWYYAIDQSKAISFAPDRDPNIPWQPLYKHPAPASDPVAWMVYTLDGQSVCVTDNPADFGESHRALPLYTTPPAAAQPAERKAGCTLCGYCAATGERVVKADTRSGLVDNDFEEDT
jgi:hypothetical protein